MQLTFTNYLPLLLAFCSGTFAAAPGKNAILLSNVQSLTLRGGQMTTHRRVPAVPQLKCVGPSQICKLYSIDTMRCTNQGYGYDKEDIEWTCTASLPPEFKLGSTDVVCEGYRSSDDPWVLKGSCGVEYRLLLTEAGERKYGHLNQWYETNKLTQSDLSSWLFWVMLIAIVAFILYALWDQHGYPRRRGGGGGRRPWGPGGPGGGGGGGGGWRWDDPPPPYDDDSNWKPSSSSRFSRSFEPGFWTGAAAGAAAGSAAGYAMGRRSRGSSRSFRYDPGDPGEGSSRLTPDFSSSRPSTGFGSTSRR